MRVTADTNTIVSGSLWHGNPRRILEAAHSGTIELFTSLKLIAELEEVLGRGKFAAIISKAESSPREIVRNYRLVATVINAEPVDPVVIRDPDDDEVIACAVASRSEVIVSGDNDLLDLKRYKNIRILTATELLSELNLQ